MLVGKAWWHETGGGRASASYRRRCDNGAFLGECMRLERRVGAVGNSASLLIKFNEVRCLMLKGHNLVRAVGRLNESHKW